jgi:protein arginine N-methyltransferase 1
MPYSLRDYGKMISDEVRAPAYAEALRRTVRPGDVVLDLGAGTGIFSLLACRFGASRVHACDTNAALEVARELARRNGFGDRIVCHEGPSGRLTLPERVDVIVSDLRGVLPLAGRAVSTLIDARARLAKPEARILPERDELWLALAFAPDDHRRAVTPWLANDLGFDLGPWSARLAQSWMPAHPRSSDLLSRPVRWWELDYRTVENGDARRRVTCLAERDGEAHGFFLWFDAVIAGQVGFSGGPDAPKLPYGSAFFPFPRPLSLAAGRTVEIDLAATLIGEDYTWTWRTTAGETSFEQSTFFAAGVSAKTLRRREESHVPQLTDEGLAALRALEELRRRRPLGQIADELLVEFPGQFASRAACLGFVADLSVIYGV